MSGPAQIELAYFPGCSLATTAMESNVSLKQSAQILGLNLIELEDWNCCGSSSAQTLTFQRMTWPECRSRRSIM
jgi:heterodisulfide reductase subunit B2